MRTVVIGIAGGSGSGKTTFADLVCANLDDADLAVWESQFGTGGTPLHAAIVVPEVRSLL